jgi:hypothetical protein
MPRLSMPINLYFSTLQSTAAFHFFLHFYILQLSDAGMYFFDYGNAFLLESQRAGADVGKPGEEAGATASFRSASDLS